MLSSNTKTILYTASSKSNQYVELVNKIKDSYEYATGEKLEVRGTRLVSRSILQGTLTLKDGFYEIDMHNFGKTNIKYFIEEMEKVCDVQVIQLKDGIQGIRLL